MCAMRRVRVALNKHTSPVKHNRSQPELAGVNLDTAESETTKIRCLNIRVLFKNTRIKVFQKIQIKYRWVSVLALLLFEK